MKKLFIVLLVIVIGFFIVLKVFNIYNANNVLSNQAAFEVYTNMDAGQIDKFFDIPEGSFDPEKHKIVCKLPVNTTGFKPGYATVKSRSNIDCEPEVDMDRLIKYDNAELIADENYLQLLIVPAGMPMSAFGEQLHGKSVIGSKAEEFVYGRGKINRVMISRDSVYSYCK